jgi:hypothetical protein
MGSGTVHHMTTRPTRYGGTLDHVFTVPLDPLDQSTAGPGLDHWTTGLLDHWTTGPLDHWTTGTLDHWTTGYQYSGTTDPMVAVLQHPMGCRPSHNMLSPNTTTQQQLDITAPTPTLTHTFGVWGLFGVGSKEPKP